MSVLRTPLGLTVGVLAAAILGSSSALLFRPESVFLEGRATAASSELRSQREVLFDHIEKLLRDKLALEQRIASLDEGLRTGEAALNSAKTERDALAEEKSAALAAIATLQESMKVLQAERDGLSEEKKSLVAERDTLTAERDTLSTARDALTAERDTLTAERDTLSTARDALTAERDTLATENEALGSALARERSAAEAARAELGRKLEESEARLTRLSAERETLIEEREAAKKDRDLLALRVEGFAAQLESLKERLKEVAPVAPTAESAERSDPIDGAPRQGPPKAITAKVAAVNDAEGIVVLDVGEANGVREGARFRIRRDGKPLATVAATKVQKDFTGCQVLKRESPESIQPADLAELEPEGQR